ncbi:MAG: carboxypeptidase regulatory-like domain-containing protein, partial [Planctomycetota bacterium JB042]
RAARLGVSDPLLRERLLTADADGRIDLDPAEPGEWRLLPLRGGAAERVTCPVHAKDPVRLTIPEGVDVAGRALDPRGLPAAGVRVTLSRAEAPDEMIEATRTDGDGLYRLRDVEPGRSIGFLADGSIPVPLRRIDGSPGERRSFDVDLADAESPHVVRGRVLDASGAPVAGARVQIGARLAWLDFDAPLTSLAQRSPPLELVTDPDGRFERRGFVAYPDGGPVWARAPGRPLATGTIRLERDAADVVLTEPEATTLRGRVVEEDGAPIARARVVLRDPRVDDAGEAPRWVESVAWSDADGRFVLPGAPLGTVHLTARAPDGREATATLDAAAEARWTAVVREPRALHGRVVRRDGRPLADLRVRALVPNGRIEPTSTTTDAWGRFDLGPLEPTTYDLWITDPASAWSGPVATVPEAVPGAPLRVEVEPRRIPDASISGRLVDERGAALPGRLFLRHVGVGLATALADPATGRFRFGPLPALGGGYQLHAESGDRFVRVGAVAPEPGAPLDVGDLRLVPPGAVRFRIEAADVPDLTAAAVTSLDGAWLEPVRIDAGEAPPAALPPGRYLARLLDPSLGQCPTPFVVRSGEETDVTLRPAPAASRTFEVHAAPFVFALGLEFHWKDEDGTPRGHDRLSGRSVPIRFRQGFAPGRYRIEVVTGRGRTAAVPFAVAAPGDDAPPVIVDLR